jgi:Domain of unknown function (DUF4136)
MKRILVALLLIGSIISCRKTPDTSQLTNKFVVITNRDPNANFSSYKTFTISDTVAYISNTPSADSIIVGAPALALVNAVKTNMVNRHYTFVPRSGTFDLGLKITALKQLNTGVVYPPGWWWGYWGYPGYCYWGCYPPYWGYPVAYAYNVGDLIVEMIDVKNAGTNHNLKRIWIQEAGGVLSSTSQTNLDLSVEAINQAFTQSPYIQTN